MGYKVCCSMVQFTIIQENGTSQQFTNHWPQPRLLALLFFVVAVVGNTNRQGLDSVVRKSRENSGENTQLCGL